METPGGHSASRSKASRSSSSSSNKPSHQSSTPSSLSSSSTSSSSSLSSSASNQQQLAANSTIWQVPVAACWNNYSNYQTTVHLLSTANEHYRQEMNSPPAVLFKMPAPPPPPHGCGGLCGTQNGCDLCSMNN